MQVISGQTVFELSGKSAVAIGKFDGIHLGHQKLLRYILKQKEQGYQAVVFTFDPPPSVYFKWTDDLELQTRAEKLSAFEKLGIDVVIEFPMNAETAATPPEDFITELLIKKLHMAYIAAGTDVSFGYKGTGNAALLHAMSRYHDYEVEIIDKVCLLGHNVSSSYARAEVEKGNMEKVQSILGYPYFVTGKVVTGKQFGRTIGMPTLNQLPEEKKLLPPAGVYYSEVELLGKRYAGMTNIGCKPTVSDTKQVGVETYLYDFSGDVYGENITVMLLSYKRPEQKFASKDALKNQMEEDLRDGEIFHKNRKQRNR